MSIDGLIVSVTESSWLSILTIGLIVVVVIGVVTVFVLKYAKGSIYLELPGSIYSGGDEIKGHVRVVRKNRAHNLCVTLQAELVWYEEKRLRRETERDQTFGNSLQRHCSDSWRPKLRACDRKGFSFPNIYPNRL